jgi:hypothetical protein
MPLYVHCLFRSLLRPSSGLSIRSVHKINNYQIKRPLFTNVIMYDNVYMCSHNNKILISKISKLCNKRFHVFFFFVFEENVILDVRHCLLVVYNLKLNHHIKWSLYCGSDYKTCNITDK